MDIKVLLSEWGLDELIEDFQAKGIDIEVFKELTSSDIDNLIPLENFGIRIKFRKSLFAWKNTNGCSTPLASSCSTPLASSVHSKIESWLDAVPIVLNDEASTSNILTSNNFNVNTVPSNLLLIPNCNEIEEHCLQSVLEKTVKGQTVLKYYERNKCLDNKTRSYLVHIIIDYMILKYNKVTPNNFELYSQKIAEQFPTESPLTYYSPRQNKKNPSGKLYDRYFNLKFETKKLRLDPETSKSNFGQLEAFTPEDDIEHYIAFLSTNNDPQLWGRIEDYWKRTSTYRLHTYKEYKDATLTDLLKIWPKYNDPRGHVLINIDFETLYPEKSFCLLNQFSDVSNKVLGIFETDIKDKLSLQQLNLLKLGELSNDSRNLFILLLLHSILQPRRLSRKFKPTIADSQEDFILHVTTINDIIPKIESIRNIYREKKIRLQPRVVVVGPTKEQLEAFYVYNDSIKYKFNNLLECVDSVIKLVYVLNLDFSPISKLVWIFLAKQFYDIPQENTGINCLISKLNK